MTWSRSARGMGPRGASRTYLDSPDGIPEDAERSMPCSRPVLGCRHSTAGTWCALVRSKRYSACTTYRNPRCSPTLRMPNGADASDPPIRPGATPPTTSQSVAASFALAGSAMFAHSHRALVHDAAYSPTGPACWPPVGRPDSGGHRPDHLVARHLSRSPGTALDSGWLARGGCVQPGARPHAHRAIALKENGPSGEPRRRNNSSRMAPRCLSGKATQNEPAGPMPARKPDHNSSNPA